MKDIYKTKAKLIAELEALRRQAEGQELTTRIQIQPQLRERNDLLESVFSNLPILIAYLDTDFNFIRVNEAYARSADRPSAYFPGKNYFTLYPQEKNKRIFRRAVVSGEAYSMSEKPFVYPGHPGKMIYWDWTIQPLKVHQGVVSGLILSLINVTPRVEARKQIEIYAGELKMKNEVLSDFASIASHDLQEPLRKILTFGNRLESNLAATLTPGDRDYLERMQSAARRMRTMLDGLLRYSRVTAITQPNASVNLARAAKEAVSNLQILIEETDATIAIGPLPELRADFSQMLQLFQNLIGNAIKFHRKGLPPLVKVSGKNITDKNRVGTLVKRCEIRVEDNGIGIKPEYIERIFLPFERLQGRQGPEGAGMGLAISRKIVEQHGGSITAESEPGKGSVFIVTLPIHL